MTAAKDARDHALEGRRRRRAGGHVRDQHLRRRRRRRRLHRLQGRERPGDGHRRPATTRPRRPSPPTSSTNVSTVLVRDRLAQVHHHDLRRTVASSPAARSPRTARPARRKQSVLSAATLPVGNVSPSTVGIVLAKDGTVSFDGAKFSAAMAADPVGTQKIVSDDRRAGRGGREGSVRPDDGSLSLKIQGQQSFVKNLSDQVDNWDTRLALRRTDPRADLLRRSRCPSATSTRRRAGSPRQLESLSANSN